MIKGHENHTYELNDYEEKILLPAIIAGFNKNHKGRRNAIKSEDIIKCMKAKAYKISGVRLRKIIHEIRVSGAALLVSNSKGYYIGTDHEDIQKCIDSFKQRENSIKAAREGMEAQLYVMMTG